MNDAEKWFKLHRAEIAVKGLIKHGFQARYIPDRQEAVQAIMDMRAMPACRGAGKG